MRKRKSTCIFLFVAIYSSVCFLIAACLLHTGTQKEIKYLVNFDRSLSECISETKYLETLGFVVPELARNVALQVKVIHFISNTVHPTGNIGGFFLNPWPDFQEDKYIKYVDGLRHMLKRYHRLLGSLDNAETTLLEDQMRELRRVIRPGAKRLNWNSLSINEFITKCDSVSNTRRGVRNKTSGRKKPNKT